MSLIRLLVIPLAGLILLSCTTLGSAESLPIRTIAKGALSAIQKPTQEIIKNKADWQKAWARYTANKTPADALPQIDFSKEMLILVAMGQQRTGGHQIEVTKVEKGNDKLQIEFRETKPSPGSITTQALTAPFHIVAVPRSDLPAEFEPSDP